MKKTPFVQNLIVLRENGDGQNDDKNRLLRLMICNEPYNGFIIGQIIGSATICEDSPILAIPKHWGFSSTKNGPVRIEFTDKLVIPVSKTEGKKDNNWILISDGRFLTLYNNDRIHQVLTETKADVLTFNVVPELAVSYEKVLTAGNDELVGFRLFYEDSLQPAPLPQKWPHHLFIRYSFFEKIPGDKSLPLDFNNLIQLCDAKSGEIQSFKIGGSVLDLTQESGLLSLVRQRLSVVEQSENETNNDRENSVSIAAGARVFGRVIFGKNVEIGENAVIAGPALIGDNVKIGPGAAICMSVIGPGVSVQSGDLIEQRVLIDSSKQFLSKSKKTGIEIQWSINRNNFRNWEKYSYACCIKRIFDIIVSTIVLILFTPFIPVIMLAIKLTSAGPIFFKDVRQGLHGKAFKCLKFRTMQVGADKMQERLRGLSLTDGPQFMIPDDPRITGVGKFLRETYLDEIPQFINVLLGQMSVVGPRPSPERENRLCPFWRDARLSVRPGITGLWQVCRTRGRLKDFQEWIHYDIRYVRELSFKMDLWICIQTAKKMAVKFFSQF